MKLLPSDSLVPCPPATPVQPSYIALNQSTQLKQIIIVYRNSNKLNRLFTWYIIELHKKSCIWVQNSLCMSVITLGWGVVATPTSIGSSPHSTLLLHHPAARTSMIPNNAHPSGYLPLVISVPRLPARRARQLAVLPSAAGGCSWGASWLLPGKCH